MRDIKTRIFALLAILLVSLILPCSAATTQRLIWEGYHKDAQHLGQNQSSTDITNPAGLNLIWVFPRDDGGSSDGIVVNGSTDFSKSGAWTKQSSSEAYGNPDAIPANSDYYATPALDRTNNTTTTIQAHWNLPIGLNGTYQVWIWVPSDSTNTTQAEYTVNDDTGNTTIRFDQSDGGDWKLLSSRIFSFKNNLASYGVTLQPITNDSDSDITTKHLRVVADAIKFVQVTSQEIYASPVSAEIDYNWSSGSLNWTGTAPAVYIGTVDPPYSSANDAPDMGSVYCIDSVTPTAENVDDGTSLGGDTAKQDLYKNLRKNVGTAKWKYPRKGADRLDIIKFPVIGANDTEGPIEGGVYASPTLYKADLNANGISTLMCFVAGMDGQIYAFDAETGRLLWQGPGVTKSEGTTLTGWSMEPDRDDAFGGRFHYASINSSVAPVTWNFETDLAEANPITSAVKGWSYAAYAWIPAQAIADGERAKDATYTITYSKYDSINGSANATATVVVDQSEPTNQGRWVRLGSSYFNIKSVSLTSTSNDTGTKVVVADAVKIAPDTLGPFGYSSPVVDDKLSGVVADLAVYGVTSNGRAVAMYIKSSSANRIGRAKWVYPEIRTSIQVTGSATADQAEWGDVTASPAYYYDGSVPARYLYVATQEGVIHCLTGLEASLADATTHNPTEAWSYNDSDLTGGFSSSPVIDAGDIDGPYAPQVLIGSTGGAFYGIDAIAGPDANQLPLFRYPEEPKSSTPGPNPRDLPAMPLGSFRFSTAAVGRDLGGMRRAWIGSNDGHIYSFVADRNQDATIYGKRIWSEYNDDGAWIKDNPPGIGKPYKEPSLLSPIQGSVALDGRDTALGKPPIMYVGDMKGKLQWYNADNGTVLTNSLGGGNYKSWQTEGELFSSPNITQFEIPGITPKSVSYVYVGCSDGRIYAFSSGDGGAWGGKWAMENWWPFDGQKNSNDAKEESYAADSDIQFDIFPSDFFDQSDPSKFNAEEHSPDAKLLAPDTNYPNISQPANPGWLADNAFIVTKEMKMPTGLPSNPTDLQIKDELRKQAKEQRNNVFQKAQRIGGSDKTVYLEWGQTINLVLWNLPQMAGLYPAGPGGEKSKRSNIRFTLSNASAGESAGSQIRMSGVVKVLKEYTVLDESTKNSYTDSGDNKTYYYADPLMESSTGSPKPVKRCYALATIDISGTSSRPPSPGPGWNLVAELKTQASTKSAITMYTIPLAKLKSGSPPEPVMTGPAGSQEYVEQPLGINNPLGIRVNGNGSSLGMAWSSDGKTKSDNPEAHYNGNSIINTGSGGEPTFGRQSLMLDLGFVAHGSVSPELSVGIQDRSAEGCVINSSSPLKTETIQRFRVNAGDLKWNGGEAAISITNGSVAYGRKFPWELGPGSSDYPNIYRRNQSFRKATDDQDPSRQATSLPPVVPLQTSAGVYSRDYSVARIRTESVFVSVNVPKYQPANINGYSKKMQAFIDSDGDREWDSGDTVLGRPSTYQEAFREFRVGMKVPPDPKIQVEEQLIDIGRAPHGLGEQFAFNAYNLDPMIRPWFKEITIKNAGNVNLYNMRIGHNLVNGSGALTDLSLFSDQASPTAPLPGGEITSSLDPLPAPYNLFNQAPFTTTDGIASLGYTLTKPRVGDPDPTVLTIPDSRKWTMDYGSTKNLAASVMQQTGWPIANPIPVRVSVRVPLSQPIGNYFAPFVPVYADLYPNTSGSNGNFEPNQGEPFADPSFQLKIAVREAQLTGGVTATTLPMIDKLSNVKFGDTTPAGFVDAETGNVYIYWSSNRVFDPALAPDPFNPADPAQKNFMGAPWFINNASLKWGGTNSGFTPDSTTQTWFTIPTQPYPVATGWAQWPTTLLDGSGGGAVLPWASTALKSVRHESPVIAENYEVASTAKDDRTWLAWAGTADIKNNTGLTQEHRLFYVDASHGVITSSSNGPNHEVHTIDQDPQMNKRSPSMAVYGNRMWMLWQGALKDKWGIFYSVNDDGPKHDPSQWKTAAQLKTPDCLASVSSPNVLHRTLWSTAPADAKHLLDVVYSGTNKLSQNSDILLGRYMATISGDPGADRTAQPANRAQPLPRVYAERLQRDATYNVYISKHLAWLRLDQTGYNNVKNFINANPTSDQLLFDWPGMQEHLAFENWIGSSTPVANLAGRFTVLFNTPYVWVDIPAGYDANYPQGAIVSATDGSIQKPGQNGLSTVVDPQPIMPLIDSVTGVYTYKYPQPETAAILGDMLVDYSSGVIRFTKTFKEVRSTSQTGKMIIPEVYADYTPQTWRLTTDPSADDSARAFIENTQMTSDANPGMCKWVDSSNNPKPAPVDRLWALWRKAGTGVNSSTIFYSTYRIGVDLTKMVDSSGDPARPIKWTTTPSLYPTSVAVTGTVIGPWEVDRTGTKVYFTQVDERYRSLVTSGSASMLGSGPGPVTIKYTNIDDKSQEVVVDDLYWLPELPEQSLFGFTSDGNINEGSVYAFADPAPKCRKNDGTFGSLDSSKIWVFWTSTRGGSSDLFWETLSPNFSAK